MRSDKDNLIVKLTFETEYWLMLCEISKNYPKNELLKDKLQSITNILSKIISTSKSH